MVGYGDTLPPTSASLQRRKGTAPLAFEGYKGEGARRPPAFERDRQETHACISTK